MEKEPVIVLRMCSVTDPIRMLRARRRAGLRISLRSFGSAAVGAIFAIGFWGLMVCSDITLGLIALAGLGEKLENGFDSEIYKERKCLQQNPGA